MHYNRYGKFVGLSIKCSSSKNSVLDGERGRQLFVCNKSGKNDDINEMEVPPVRHRNRSITKKHNSRRDKESRGRGRSGM
jgi:hypothetical protein